MSGPPYVKILRLFELRNRANRRSVTIAVRDRVKTDYIEADPLIVPIYDVRKYFIVLMEPASEDKLPPSKLY